MKHLLIPLEIITFSLLYLVGNTQSIFDTTSWKEVSCVDGNYTLKYPHNYFVKNECKYFFNFLNGKKIVTIDFNVEKYRPQPKYSLKQYYTNLSEWIAWRAGADYGADGPDEGIYGDSIATNISFKNKYGISFNELYVYVTCTQWDSAHGVKYTDIRGPVFAVKLNPEAETDVQVLFIRLNEDFCTKDDEAILRLMVDNFTYIKNKYTPPNEPQTPIKPR
jgi:hypothetical protein